MEPPPLVRITRDDYIDESYGETKNQIESNIEFFKRARNAGEKERLALIAEMEESYRWEVGIQDGLAAAPSILFAIPASIGAEVRTEYLRYRLFYKLAYMQGYSLSAAAKPTLDYLASGNGSFSEAVVIASANRVLLNGVKALPTTVWKASAKYLGRGVLSKAGKTGMSAMGLIPFVGAVIAGSYAAHNITEFIKSSLENLPWFDVFLSHNWGSDNQNHKRVAMLSDELSRRGVRVWLDEDELRGNKFDSMEKGILGSKIFVMMVTQDYLVKINRNKDVDACAYETHIAIDARPPSNFIIVMLEDIKLTLPKHLIGLYDEIYVNCLSDSVTEVNNIVKEIQYRISL